MELNGPPTGTAQDTSLAEAIRWTLCYREVFDFPLTRHELRRHLLLCPASEAEVDQALAEMAGGEFDLVGEYVLPRNRPDLPAVRARRAENSAQAWSWARRYADWLRWVPFVRMVAVSGSLAVDNLERGGDIDLFCLTAPGRLWIARIAMSIFGRLSTWWLPYRACLNTSLSLAALELPERNVYLAHQIELLVPMWGREAYRQFVAANAWAREYLPRLLEEDKTPAAERPSPWLTRAVEWLLRGPWGDRLNRYVYRRGLRRGRRWQARQQGRAPGDLPQARQLECYRLIPSHEQTIRQRFAAICRARFGAAEAERATEKLFGTASPGVSETAVPGSLTAANYYQQVGRYFDDEAPAFSGRNEANGTLQRMRDRFREVTSRFSFSEVLEIGCGPGLDLEYWARQRPAAQVCGLDVSPAMIREAEARLRAAGLTNAACACGSVEDIGRCFPGRRFDLVYVYFGALNTVADLGAAARCLRTCLRPGGMAVVTLVNRWCLQETLWRLLTLRWGMAFARWRETWGGYAPGRFLPSRCYAPPRIRRTFAPFFHLRQAEGFCLLHPTWYRDRWARRFPRFCAGLWRLDRLLARTLLGGLGEYLLYVFEAAENIVDGGGGIAEPQRAAAQEVLVPGPQPD